MIIMETKPKILFADKRPMCDEALKMLYEVGEIVWSASETENDLIKEMKDAVVVVSGLRYISRRAIFNAEKLKGIIAYGVGVDHIDVAAATEKKVYVVNTPGVNSISVAEYAMGLMLSLARKIPQQNASVKAGKWLRWELIGNELWGKTLGIVGLGHVGAHLATLGKAFGMKVLSFTRHPSKERAEKWGVEFVNLETLMSASDFIVICCALTDETRGLIDDKKIRLMKPSAYLINVARGQVVDEQALALALAERRIAGAGIDVFEKEPPDLNNPLLKFDNVIVSAHIAGFTVESMRRLQMTVAEEAARIIKGEPPRFQVNKFESSPRLCP